MVGDGSEAVNSFILTMGIPTSQHHISAALHQGWVMYMQGYGCAQCKEVATSFLGIVVDVHTW